ncbi:DUF4468 domain-containing protein [Mucilaginibacter sp. RCC_168]|uniref:DUF4468 domain-containing protein n=1 Tax=Mucilaginibacter sp. RCC_168 TaxID=3239221 RepID=UPI003524F31A
MIKLMMPAIILVLITKTVFAQKDTIGLNTPFINGAVVYEKVFNAPGKSKSDLFNKGQLWLIARYKNIDVIQILNDSTGTIVGKGREVVRFRDILWRDAEFKADMSLQIDCKDGKYRCRLFNIKIRDTVEGKDIVLGTPEDLMNYLIGNKGNPVRFSKTASKRILQSLNNTMNGVMLAINQSMSQNDDF